MDDCMAANAFSRSRVSRDSCDTCSGEDPFTRCDGIALGRGEWGWLSMAAAASGSKLAEKRPTDEAAYSKKGLFGDVREESDLDGRTKSRCDKS